MFKKRAVALLMSAVFLLAGFSSISAFAMSDSPQDTETTVSEEGEMNSEDSTCEENDESTQDFSEEETTETEIGTETESETETETEAVTEESTEIVLDEVCPNISTAYIDSWHCDGNSIQNGMTVEADNHVSIVIGGISDEESGIDRVVVSLKAEYADGTVESVERTCRNQGDNYVIYTGDYVAANTSYDCSIERIVAYDKSENHAEISGDAIEGNLTFRIENKNILSEYNYNDGSGVYDASTDTRYFDKDVYGSIEFRSMHWLFWNVDVVNSEGYNQATIALSETASGYKFDFNTDNGEDVNNSSDNKQYRFEIKRSIFGFELPSQYSSTIVVDKVAPVVTYAIMDANGNGLSDYKDKVYKGTLGIDVQVDEYNAKTLYAQIINEYSDTPIELCDFEFDSTVGRHSLHYDFTEDGDYKVIIYCEDWNGRICCEESGSFTIDNTVPIVTIEYDNQDVHNGYYYNKERKATITVEENNFDDNLARLNIIAKYNHAIELGAWTEEGSIGSKRYIGTVVFGGDDEYSGTFECTDMAGNAAEVIAIEKFVVDCTEPKVHVTRSDNNPLNEYYYNSNIDVDIDVEDISFSENLVTLNNISEENGIAAEFSGWNIGDSTSTTSVSCGADGAYHFTIQAEDLAGNKSEVIDSNYFVIDTLLPEVTIEGVVNESANNGELAPIVKLYDINLDDKDSVVSLTGYKNGDVENVLMTAKDKYSLEYLYNVFPNVRSSDDVYTLNASAIDLAGNVQKEECLFSINRFGSTYGVDASTSQLIEKYYTNEEQDIVIFETNVDEVAEENIYVVFNGDSRRLKRGRDYSVTKQGDTASWKSYTYVIDKHNFEKEGIYELSFFSKDRANNSSDTNAQDINISFAVDKSAPSIVVSGIESSKKYEEVNHSFNFEISDNLCSQTAKLYVNGALVTDYGDDKLSNTISYSLAESDSPYEVRIVATDEVGNTDERVFSDIIVSTKIVELAMEDNDTPLGSMPLLSGNNRMNILIIVVGVMVIMAIGVTSVMILNKKKSYKED